MIANVDAGYDDCVDTARTVEMTGKNDRRSAERRRASRGDGSTTDGRAHRLATTARRVCRANYNSHYAPFQYYRRPPIPITCRRRPSARSAQTDQANHQYDLNDFWNAATQGSLPAVSFLKPPTSETGHPDDSTPLAEQRFLVDTINALQRTAGVELDMAILITYDDSDGWYDHVMPPIMSQLERSRSGRAVRPEKLCGTPAGRCLSGSVRLRPTAAVPGDFAVRAEELRRPSLTDVASILRFIEDNWQLGRLGDQSFDAMAGSILDLFNFTGPRPAPLFLDPETGEPVP